MPDITQGSDLLPIVRQLENSGDSAVSSAGAVGRYQIEPSTAKQYGFDPSKLTDPDYNQQVAGAVLNDLYKRYNGDTSAVLAGYNGGPSRANEYLKANKDRSVLPPETQKYLSHADQLLAQSQPTPEQPKPGLPSVFDQVSQARKAGYSWDDINSYYGDIRSKAKAAGYSDAEINQYFGLPPDHGTPVPQENYQSAKPISFTDGFANSPVGRYGVIGAIEHIPEELADWWKAQMAAGDRYAAIISKQLEGGVLTQEEKQFEQSEMKQQAYGLAGGTSLPIRSVGDLFRAGGADATIARHIYGDAPVDGAAAATELLDGRPRSKEAIEDLKKEASQYTDLPSVAKPEDNTYKMPMGLPATNDVLDAATGIGGDLNKTAANLGRHFIETGEHPLDAAARAQSDAELHAKLTDGVIDNLDETIDKLNNLALAAQAAGDNALRDEILAEADRTIAARRHSAKRVQSDAELHAKLTEGGHVTEYNPLTGEGGQPMTPATVQMRNTPVAHGIVDNFKRIYDPASRTPEAGEVAGIVREAEARTDLSNRQAAYALHKFGRVIKDMPPDKQQQFIDAYQKGGPDTFPKGSPVGEMAKALKTSLDKDWAEMDKRGIAPDYVQNYLTQMYKTDELSQARIDQARAYIRGKMGKTFTRKRMFESYAEAEKVLGLTPKTTDPLELALVHHQMVQRFIQRHDIEKELIDSHLVQFRPHDVTKAEADKFAGMVPIDNMISPGPNGRWYAPEPVAHILNTHLSTGWTGQPAYDMARSISSVMTMGKLMLSAFHPVYMGIASIGNRFALGAKQFSRLTPEEMLEGAKTMATSPIAPYLYLKSGRAFIKSMLEDDILDGEPRTIADAFLAGGNRIGGEKMYQASAYGSFWEGIHGSVLNLAQHLQGIPKEQRVGPLTLSHAIADMYREAAPIKIFNRQVLPSQVRATALFVPRFLDTVMAPIMSELVPAIKAGAILDLARDNLRINPGMSHPQLRDVMYEANRSVDNRLGLMTRNNRFWNKSLNDAGQLAFLAENWMLGHLDEMGKGITDLLKGGEITPSGMRQLSDHTTQVLGIIVATAFVHAIYGFIKGTWAPNWGVKDYMAPPTGGTDKQGGIERVMAPSMVRDMWEWGTEPRQTVGNKLSPAWDIASGILNDRQWNGAALYDPNDSFPDMASDYATNIGKQFIPLAFNNAGVGDQANISHLENWLGIRQAPFNLREPELEHKYEDRDTKKAVRKMYRTEGQ